MEHMPKGTQRVGGYFFITKKEGVPQAIFEKYHGTFLAVTDPLGGDYPVWRSQTVSDGVITGCKILDFLVKFAAQEAYLLECSKYQLFSGTK